MFHKIKTMLTGSRPQEPEQKKHDISLAVTAMMIEIMHIDGKLKKAEHTAIFTAIEQRFGLTHEEICTLMDEAKQAQADATDLHQFTSLINQQFSTEERIDFLKDLWQVAMADGHVDPYEEQLIRRIAGLVGVYHDEFIQAKISARDTSRLTQG